METWTRRETVWDRERKREKEWVMKAIKAAGHVVWTSDNKPLLLSRTVLEELIAVDRS